MSKKNSDPQNDGDALPFLPGGKIRCYSPKFYYVNGIQTGPTDHRAIAELIANITESRVTGIYNATSGFVGDMRQCLGDWIHIVSSQLGEKGFFRDRLSQQAINEFASVDVTARWTSPYLHAMREAYIAPASIPAKSGKTIQQLRARLKRNKASLTLFDELSANLDRRQIVVAHSQGNLITSFTLWAIQAGYGSTALSKIQIRSISSPSPAWPRGINHQIKVYGQRDDPVTWFDLKNLTGNRSEGYWDVYFLKNPAGYLKSGGIAAHDTKYNIKKTSLYRRLRADAGLEKF